MSNYPNHVSGKHIIVNVKSKEDKKVLKISKFFLMLWILRWRIEKQLVTVFSKESWTSLGKTYTLYKLSIFLLKKMQKSASYALPNKMSFESFNMLYCRVSKF